MVVYFSFRTINTCNDVVTVVVFGEYVGWVGVGGSGLACMIDAMKVLDRNDQSIVVGLLDQKMLNHHSCATDDSSR